jgi:dTDP-D-glucose 4,6-dehydratase
MSNLNLVKEKVNVVEGNILDQTLVQKLVSESDYIVHLAAALGVFNIVNKPLESLKTNLKGSEIVLEAADEYKKPVLIASTSEVYGKNDKVPLNEEDDRIIGHPLKSRWSMNEEHRFNQFSWYSQADNTFDIYDWLQPARSVEALREANFNRVVVSVEGAGDFKIALKDVAKANLEFEF